MIQKRNTNQKFIHRSLDGVVAHSSKNKDIKINKDVFDKKSKKYLTTNNFLYSSYQIKSILWLSSKKIIAVFFNKSRRRLAIAALLFIFITSFFFQNSKYSQGATYYWTQNNWSGGATTNNNAHSLSGNQNDWNQFASNPPKDAFVDETVNGGNDLKLKWTPEASIQSFDTGSGDIPNAGGFNAGTKTNTRVRGSGDDAEVDLAFAGITAVSSGEVHSLAIKSDNTVWAWGNNGDGQLGDGTDLQRLSPVQIINESGDGYIQDIEAISAGKNHSLALMSDGTILAWGKNDSGQLGDGTNVNHPTPMHVVDIGGSGHLGDIIAISAGDSFSLALKKDGTVLAWGKNSDGQLGSNNNTDTSIPVQVTDVGGNGVLGNVSAIAAGNNFSVVLKGNGTVLTWGNNDNGQLGDETTIGKISPVQVGDSFGTGLLSDISKIAVGGGHVLALKNDGNTIWAWGLNDQGQLGNNSKIDSHLPVRVQDFNGAGFLTNISSVKAGYKFSAAIKVNKELLMWGENESGQLGNGTIAGEILPTQVSSVGGSGILQNVVEVSCGRAHVLAVETDGTLVAWGKNSFGQVGNNYNADINYPEFVFGPAANTLDEITKISYGYSHALALKSDGTVWSWGWNGYGQLGDGTIVNRLTPVQVRGANGIGYLSNVREVIAGFAHSIAILNDNTVVEWGWGAFGQLGNGGYIDHYLPTPIPGLDSVSKVSTRDSHVVALKSDGTVWAWGKNFSGQIGNNTDAHALSPVQVFGLGGTGNLSSVIDVSAGGSHSLAVLSSGTVVAWGGNDNGQLGNNSINGVWYPVQVLDDTASDPLSGIVAISAGDLHSLALSTDHNTVWAWGRNGSGQLGRGNTNDSSVALKVNGIDGSSLLNGVSQIQAGGNHSIALLNDQTLAVWGSNTYGQLGLGDNQNKNNPQLMKDESGNVTIGGVTFISSGFTNSGVGISGQQKVWAVGANNYGQLGINTVSSKNLLVNVWDGAKGTFNIGSTYYFSSGDFLSAVVDTGSYKTFTTVNRDFSIPDETAITLDVRAGNSNTPDGTWTSWITDVSEGQNIASSIGQKRYYQFRANLSTLHVGRTPSLQSVTLNYNYFPSPGYIASSPYNTSDGANILSKIQWVEDVSPIGTDVQFQVRTAPDVNGAPGTWTSWCGPDDSVPDACSSATYFTDNSGSEIIDTLLKDGMDDQWIQYRAQLVSDGINSPTLSSVTTQYVVNAPPQVQTVSASQINDENDPNYGKVVVNYEVRDPDANCSGLNPCNNVTPGKVAMGLQYCKFNCDNPGAGDWSQNVASVTGNVGSGIDVQELEWNSYALVWDAKADYPDYFDGTDFKVRVVADDSEGANRYGYGQSNQFIFDTKDPVNVTFSIDNTNDKLNIIAPIDDSSFEVYVSDSGSNLFDADNKTNPLLNKNSTYPNSYGYSLGSDPVTVFIGVKDYYGNTASISKTTPGKPGAVVFYDISNSQINEFRELISWEVVNEVGSGFLKYNIFRKRSDETDYSFLAAVNQPGINYYLDKNLNTNFTYSYKINTEDTNHDISKFSLVVSDQPDGQGGESSSPPVITSVQHANITSSGATITWDTVGISSDSIVGFDEADVNGDNTQSYTKEIGVATLIENGHTVTLSGLEAGKKYFYRIKSIDAFDNIGEDDNNGLGYSFTTSEAFIDIPTISNVSTAPVVSATSATITWDTDRATDEYVGYSSGSENLFIHEQGDMEIPNPGTSHSVVLAGLQPSTTYKFQVKSRDSSDNLGKDDNGGSGYTFTTGTAPDVSYPLITNLSVPDITATSATVTWDTLGKASSSRVFFGTSASYQFVAGNESELVENHSVTISNLNSNTVYHYQVYSKSENGNDFYSSDQTLRTAQDMAYPDISNVVTVLTTDSSAIITWETDEDTDSKVVYSLDPDHALGNSLEQNISFVKNHTLKLTGLLPDSKYNYKVISRDKAGNESSSDEFQFVTEKDPEFQHAPLASISNVADPPNIITDKKAVITFDTDQPAKCLVEYGTQAGDYTTEVPIPENGYNVNHAIHLAGLIFKTNYFYKITCEDNLGTSPISSQEYSFFTTDQIGGDGGGSGADITGPGISGVKYVKTSGESVTVTWTTDEKSNSLVRYGIADTFGSMAGEDLVNVDVANYTTDHSVLISGLVPNTKYFYAVISSDVAGNISQSSSGSFMTGSASSISSINTTVVSSTEVDVTWKTSAKVTSIVEYGLTNAYGQISENKNLLQDHTIKLSGLQSGQTYHLMVKGKDQEGALYASQDYTFVTNSMAQISNIRAENIQEREVVVKFTTNILTDALVEYSDPKNPKNSGTQGKPELTTAHEITLKNLEPGVAYSYVVKVKAGEGGEVKSGMQTFKTEKDETAPVIDQVRTESALTQSDKVQSIIYWVTDEPGTGKFYYKDNRDGEEREVPVSDVYTTVHSAVITNFKSGNVYYFRVKSIDQSGNESISTEYALLTPRKKENIVQIIINNFQDIFKWAKF